MSEFFTPLTRADIEKMQNVAEGIRHIPAAKRIVIDIDGMRFVAVHNDAEFNLVINTLQYSDDMIKRCAGAGMGIYPVEASK